MNRNPGHFKRSTKRKAIDVSAAVPVVVRPLGLKAREAHEAAKALDAIIAARPLKPPPLRGAENPTRPASWYSLQREIREGSYEP